MAPGARSLCAGRSSQKGRAVFNRRKTKMGLEEISVDGLQVVEGGHSPVSITSPAAPGGMTAPVITGGGYEIPIIGEALPGGLNHFGVLGYGNSNQLAN
jgi:hypothetical protein